MVKKREIAIAILCFVILALIMLAILGFTLLMEEIFHFTGIYPFGYYTIYVVLGAAIGISAGFGFIIAQRLFDALLNK
jgi:hypothetical protein